MCVYTHIVHSMETVVGQKNKYIGRAVSAAGQGNLSACHFGQACHRLVSAELWEDPQCASICCVEPGVISAVHVEVLPSRK